MTRSACALFIALSLVGPAVYADDAVHSPTAPPPTSIRASIEKVKFDTAGRAQVRTAPQTTKHYSVATKASAGVAMGILGMLGGAMVGSWITMACGCGEPLYVGVYGGTIAGAVSGVWLASR